MCNLYNLTTTRDAVVEFTKAMADKAGWNEPSLNVYPNTLAHRKRIEEIFGWTKTVAGQAKTKFRGVGRVAASFIFAVAANNLIRLPKLVGASP